MHTALATLGCTLPAWQACREQVDTACHYALGRDNLSPDVHALLTTLTAYIPLTTLPDLIYALTHSEDLTHNTKSYATMDILLITEKVFYGTKGVSLEKLTPTNYQVTELQPNGLLIFLSGLNCLTISVIGNCVVVEDHALSDNQRLASGRTTPVRP